MSYNDSARNAVASMRGVLFNRLDIRTAGGVTILGTFTVTWAIPASGVISVASLPIAEVAVADGTAAEARFRRVGGTGSGYLVDGAFAAGLNRFDVNTGSGTFLEGDIITIAGHAQQYVISENHAGGDGRLRIFPSLRVALSGGEAITLETAAELDGLSVNTAAAHVIISNTSILTSQDINLLAATITSPASVASP